MSLSHLPIDILKATFQWIHPQSIDACLLKQTCSSIKWVLVNQMKWVPTLNNHVPFTHNLAQVIKNLPDLDAKSCESLKMTCLRYDEPVNFKFLHGEAPVLLEHVTLTAEHGHLTCLTYLLSNWNVMLENLGWQSLLDVATMNGHLSIAKWYFSKLAEYSVMTPEWAALPTMQQFITRLVTHESYHNRSFVMACEYGHLDLVKYYHSLGANPIASDNEAIQKASRNGHLHVIKHLHSLGADIKVDRNQCLTLACKNGHLPVVEFLRSAGAEVHARHDLPFRVASRFGHLDILQYLYVNECFDNVDILSKALLMACTNGHLNVITYLISIGADLHVENEDAFQRVCRNGHIEVVKYLYSNGANYKYSNWLAFRQAAQWGRLEVVQFLYSLDVDVHVMNDDAMRSASACGQIIVVKYLYSIGADIRAMDDAAFKSASANGHLDVLVFLHSVGANARADNGYAFKRAAINNHLHVLKFLLSIRGGVTRGDKDHALDSAICNRNKEMAEFLISIGADIHSLNRDFSGYPECIRLLQSL